MKLMLSILNDIRTEAIKAYESQKEYLQLLQDLDNKDLVDFLRRKLHVKRPVINNWIHLKKIPKSKIEEINHYISMYRNHS